MQYVIDGCHLCSSETRPTPDLTCVVLHFPNGRCQEYCRWIVHTLMGTWEVFVETFLRLWNDSAIAKSGGDAYPASVYNSPSLLKAAQDRFVHELYLDTIGFAAAKMIRYVCERGRGGLA